MLLLGSVPARSEKGPAEAFGGAFFGGVLVASIPATTEPALENRAEVAYQPELAKGLLSAARLGSHLPG
jgi:hypothetical protein